ncbi:MAG: lysylphosphatidylglycerol synthase domain-containing protein, partial [Anaerolineae bacterium]
WQFQPAHLAASFALVLAQLFLLAAVWRWTLARLGVCRPWRETTRIWALSQIARYLPGGIWDAAGRFAMGARAGYPTLALSLSILLEMALQALTAALAFVLSLPFWPQLPQEAGLRWAVPLSVLGLAALHPRVIQFGLRTAARLLHMEQSAVTLRYRDMLFLLFCHMLTQLCIGTGFHLFMRAVYPAWPAGLWPVAVGTYAAAWLIGFLIFFVPMGIGVREGIIVMLLAPFVPFAPANAVAIGFRLWIALRDALFAGIGVLLKAPD